jgi:peptidoglycan/xylan/chitin deacetylase (PgdA/CDA1 family)/GT2 family glycosyltransferase
VDVAIQDPLSRLVETPMSSSEPPDAILLPVSVVVPSRGRPQMLVDTIVSIVSHDRVPAEIVVVDHSKTPNAEAAELDGTSGVRVKYVHDLGRGLSRARNLGARLAAHDVVVLLDDDMLVQDGAIEQLLDAVGQNERRVATGRTLAAPPERRGARQPPGAVITRTEPTLFRGRQPRQVVPGTNIALPRKVFLELGGFDERLGPGTRFPAGDDYDLSVRLLDAGYEVQHVPASVVLHRSWRRSHDRLLVRWHYARGVGAFYAKYGFVHDPYVRGLAWRELSARFRVACRAVLSSPLLTAAQIVSLTGLITGGAEWTMLHGPRLRSGGRAVVLCYHSVSDLRGDPVLADYGVPEAQLAGQLDTLIRSGWRFVDLDALLAALRGEGSLPRRAILVTFDDGYADLLTAGVPVVAARRIPAIAFVVTGHVGGCNEWNRPDGAMSLPLLDRNGLRALAEHGIEVGSHTRSHPRLVEMSGDEVCNELDSAAADLAELGLGRPRAFAYPYGAWKREIAETVKRAGYEAAFTVDPGVVARRTDRFALPRIQVTPEDGPWRLRFKLFTAGLPSAWRRRIWSWAGIRV